MIEFDTYQALSGSTAESLFEAGVLAANAFHKAGWLEEAPGLAFRLEIEVREPAVKHTVTLQLQLP